MIIMIIIVIIIIIIATIFFIRVNSSFIIVIFPLPIILWSSATELFFTRGINLSSVRYSCNSEVSDRCQYPVLLLFVLPIASGIPQDLGQIATRSNRSVWGAGLLFDVCIEGVFERNRIIESCPKKRQMMEMNGRHQ